MADSTINVYIGHGVNPVSRNLTYIKEGSKELIAYANMNDLIFFDLNKGGVSRRIKFKEKGPNGIGHLNRFHIESLDSMYIFTYTHLIISDSLGHVFKRSDFSELVRNFPIAPMPSFYDINNKVISYQDKLNIACYLMDENFSEIQDTPTGLIYDMKKDSIYLGNRHYPSLDGNYYYSRDKGETKYVYSFYLQNKVHQISESGQYETFPCKSKHSRNKLTPVGPSENLKEQIISSIKNPRYYSLVYDKWNKLYYRFFYPGNDKIEKDKSLDYYWALKDNPEQFSVMILNDDLKVIGETLIPENTCNPFMYFINEDGLHFALHVNHPDFDPDYLKFARFTVEESNNENK
jgi:hypothetical protein